jgi:hypothetical protein
LAREFLSTTFEYKSARKLREPGRRVSCHPDKVDRSHAPMLAISEQLSTFRRRPSSPQINNAGRDTKLRQVYQ